MPLETGDYISDLVETNPPGTDNVSQGDDHLRLIKHVLKTTFPNIDGPVTSTEEELSNLGGGMPVVTTYTTPATAQTHTFGVGKQWFRVIVTGGGGGGNATQETNKAGGGGGTAIKVEAITEASATYTVGAGGAVGAAGGDSTFQQGANNEIKGEGGQTGVASENPYTPALGVNGDINVTGGGSSNGGGQRAPSIGGATYWGGSSADPDSGVSVSRGAYGAGGMATTLDYAGKAGIDGVVVIEEY